MATFSETVYIDVNLDDFDNNEIADYLRHQGYIVTENPMDDACYADIAWNVDQGKLKEALILLEREVPMLRGISRLAN